MRTRFEIEADKGQAPTRVDKFLAEHMPGTSRSRVQEAADAGYVWINGKAVSSNTKVRPGDKVEVMTESEPIDTTIQPVEMDIPVVYEDDDVLVINKPAGLVVHPGHGNYENTLLHGLQWYFQVNGFNADNTQSQIATTQPSGLQHGASAPTARCATLDMNNPEIGLVHRIDKDTSGLLLIAKTAEAKTALGKQFFDHSTERSYNALVWGTFKEDEGTIEGALDRDPRDRTRYRIFDLEENPNAKEAVTHWRVLERYPYVTLVECRLETGRTHQIRVHMKSIGHPLFGDEKYGGTEILKGLRTQKYKQYIDNCFKLCGRQALHAKTLGFTHPTTGERMQFDSEWPADFASLIDKWRHYQLNTLNQD